MIGLTVTGLAPTWPQRPRHQYCLPQTDTAAARSSAVRQGNYTPAIISPGDLSRRAGQAGYSLAVDNNGYEVKLIQREHRFTIAGSRTLHTAHQLTIDVSIGAISTTAPRQARLLQGSR
jgi:hypothetical protein